MDFFISGKYLAWLLLLSPMWLVSSIFRYLLPVSSDWQAYKKKLKKKSLEKHLSLFV